MIAKPRYGEFPEHLRVDIISRGPSPRLSFGSFFERTRSQPTMNNLDPKMTSTRANELSWADERWKHVYHGQVTVPVARVPATAAAAAARSLGCLDD